jgi:hypothetical protein
MIHSLIKYTLFSILCSMPILTTANGCQAGNVETVRDHYGIYDVIQIDNDTDKPIWCQMDAYSLRLSTDNDDINKLPANTTWKWLIGVEAEKMVKNDESYGFTVNIYDSYQKAKEGDEIAGLRMLYKVLYWDTKWNYWYGYWKSEILDGGDTSSEAFCTINWPGRGPAVYASMTDLLPQHYEFAYVYPN